jgi:hypothetical protein
MTTVLATPQIPSAALNRQWLAVVAAATGLVLAHFAALFALLADAPHGNLVLLLVEGAFYLGALWLVSVRRASLPLWIILAVAAVLRLSLLLLEPHHSTDIYRYIWEGIIQADGFSPYLHVPADPALAHLRDEAIWSRINRADYAPTIYPPAAQLIFFAATQVAATVTWMKAVLLAFEAVAIWALLKLLDREGLPRERVLAYAWCPLPAWEFAEAGHVDAAMIAFVALAVLAARSGRAALCGAMLGVATLVKLFPLALLPSLWRRWDWKLPAAFIATVILGYLPHALAAGPRVVGFLPGYAGEEGIRDASGFWPARLVRILLGIDMSAAVYLTAAAFVLAVIAVVTVRRRDDDGTGLYAGSLALGAAAMLALSPQYPWYFAWLVPFLCFVPSWPVAWLVAASPILYWGSWRSVLWNGDLLYGGALALLMATFIARCVAPSLPALRVVRKPT